MQLSDLSNFYITVPQTAEIDKISITDAVYIFAREAELEKFRQTNSSIKNINEISALISDCGSRTFVVCDTNNHKKFVVPKLIERGADDIFFYNLDDLADSPNKIDIHKDDYTESLIENRVLEHLYFRIIEESAVYAKSIGCRFYLCKYPTFQRIKNPSETEQYLGSICHIKERPKMIFIPDNIAWLKSNPPHLKEIYGELPQYSDEYISDIFAVKGCIKNFRGQLVPAPVNTEYTNVVNEMRVTAGQPEQYAASVHMFGGCSLFGFGAEDEHTIASCLQKELNSQALINKSESNVRVLNYGVHGASVSDMLLRLKTAPLKPNDTVIFINMALKLDDNRSMVFNNAIEKMCKNAGIIIHDTQYLFDRPHYMGEVFFDNGHVCFKGNRLIAKNICSLMTCLPVKPGIAEKSAVMLSKIVEEYTNFKNKELDEYIEHLKQFRTGTKNNGAIVMNCNPFTLGHRYLISSAAKKVEHLYVFVLEEDKSFFPFKDRIHLVKEGTKDIENVTVIHGGKFIISSVTFPEYFDKDHKNDIEINANNDLTIFAHYICPALNIKERFAGEEPFCKITKQYNSQMMDLLPENGIKFNEIPRFEVSGLAVSASHVRRLLKEKNIEGLRQILPDTTFDFLIKNYL